MIKGRGNFPCNFGGDRANDPEIPCIVEIKERNTDLLLKYIEKNPATDREDFSSASDIRRMNIAPACPYWAPIMPSNIEPRGLGDFKKKKYMAVCGKEFALFQFVEPFVFYHFLMQLFLLTIPHFLFRVVRLYRFSKDI